MQLTCKHCGLIFSSQLVIPEKALEECTNRFQEHFVNIHKAELKQYLTNLATANALCSFVIMINKNTTFLDVLEKEFETESNSTTENPYQIPRYVNFIDGCLGKHGEQLGGILGIPEIEDEDEEEEDDEIESDDENLALDNPVSVDITEQVNSYYEENKQNA